MMKFELVSLSLEFDGEDDQSCAEMMIIMTSSRQRGALQNWDLRGRLRSESENKGGYHPNNGGGHV
jgi:hypothetical protein